MFHPAVPYVPGALNAKAFVLKYWDICSCLDRPLGKLGLPMRSAVSLPTAVRELSRPDVTVKGEPLRTVKMPVKFHPCTACRSTAFEYLGTGTSTMKELIQLWRMS